MAQSCAAGFSLQPGDATTANGFERSETKLQKKKIAEI